MWQFLQPLIGPLLDKAMSFIPNPEERQKARLELEAQLQTALIQADQQQTDINKVEAASPSLFVAGWRPFIGWVCGFGLSWQYILQPVFTYIFAVIASYSGKVLPPLPALDNSTLYPLLMSLLGMGGLRTWEKIQGVARDNLTKS